MRLSQLAVVIRLLVGPYLEDNVNSTAVNLTLPSLESVSCNFRYSTCGWTLDRNIENQHEKDIFSVVFQDDKQTYYITNLWFHYQIKDKGLIFNFLNIATRSRVPNDQENVESFDSTQENWANEIDDIQTTHLTPSNISENIYKKDFLTTTATTTQEELNSSRTSINSVVKLELRAVRSIDFFLETEGCISFTLKRTTIPGESDSISLWAKSHNNSDSLTQLWSHYGPLHRSKRIHVGLNAGAYSLLFKGTLYVTVSYQKHWLYYYSIPDILSRSNSCHYNNGYGMSSGYYPVGDSPYSNTKCKWTPLQLSKKTVVDISLNSNDKYWSHRRYIVTVTHVTMDGFHACVVKQTPDIPEGWKDVDLVVEWTAYVDISLPTTVGNSYKTNDVTSLYERDLNSNELNKFASIPFPTGRMSGKSNRIFETTTRTYPDSCDDKYTCVFTRECVSKFKICDGYYDCTMGDDEAQGCGESKTFVFAISSSVLACVFSVLFIYLYFLRLKMIDDDMYGGNFDDETRRYLNLVEKVIKETRTFDSAENSLLLSNLDAVENEV